jgi:predicted HD phosphohydrolase
MSPAEVGRFRANADWEQAVALRRIDDRGKVVDLEVPAIEAYRDTLMRVVEAACVATA